MTDSIECKPQEHDLQIDDFDVIICKKCKSMWEKNEYKLMFTKQENSK